MTKFFKGLITAVLIVLSTAGGVNVIYAEQYVVNNENFKYQMIDSAPFNIEVKIEDVTINQQPERIMQITGDYIIFRNLNQNRYEYWGRVTNAYLYANINDGKTRRTSYSGNCRFHWNSVEYTPSDVSAYNIMRFGPDQNGIQWIYFGYGNYSNSSAEDIVSETYGGKNIKIRDATLFTNQNGDGNGSSGDNSGIEDSITPSEEQITALEEAAAQNKETTDAAISKEDEITDSANNYIDDIETNDYTEPMQTPELITALQWIRDIFQNTIEATPFKDYILLSLIIGFAAYIIGRRAG